MSSEMERQPIIRHIAASFDGTTIAVAEFERHVQIWDIGSKKRISIFETTLDFGGSRLSISRDGTVCAVGAYREHGIALYDTRTGSEIWRRKDLKRVQTIRFGADEKHLLCGLEGKAFEVLNSVNGRSKTPMRGIEDIWESPYDSVTVHDRKKRDFKLLSRDNVEIARLPRDSFAAIAYTFAPQKLCISESVGSIRCFDVNNGNGLWQFDPGNGVHALKLGYNEKAREFVAITWSYEKGGPHRMLKLDTESGFATTICVLENVHEHAFCLKGSVLVTSDGKLRDTTNATPIGELSFF